jgi:hypothetical protein
MSLCTPAWLSALALVAVLTGCGGSGSSTGTTGTTGTTGADGGPAGKCASEKRATPFHAGMAETSENGVSVALTASTPAPPRVGPNSWTLSVTDATHAAMPGAALTVAPFMVDHGHPSPEKPVIKDNGDGSYSVSPVDFNMNGYWEITITVNTAAGTELVRFPLCVE